jgi:hypothetical protein
MAQGFSFETFVMAASGQGVSGMYQVDGPESEPGPHA